MKRWVKPLGAALIVAGALAPPALAVGPPDGRVWELVSPAEKGMGSVNGYPVESGRYGITAVAASGDAVSYTSILPLSGAASGLFQSWISRRSADGWAAASASPATGVEHPRVSFETVLWDVSDDFGTSFTNTMDRLAGDDGLPAEVGRYRAYRRSGDGAWQLIAPESGSWPGGAMYVGKSGDGRLVVLESSQPSPALPDKEAAARTLYAVAGGTVTPIAAGGSGVYEQCGAALGASLGTLSNTVNGDGSRIVFTTPGADVSLDCRDNADARVYLKDGSDAPIEVSASQRVVPDAADKKVFVGASADGGTIFLASTERLTEDAAVGGGLYRYDVASHVLDYLTPPVSGQAGEIGAIAVADDGRTVYFTTIGQLDASSPPVNVPPDTLYQGTVYVWRDGVGVRAIASMIGNGADATALTHQEAGRLADISSDGARLAFAARTTEHAGRQVYVYDARDGRLSCASCQDGGAEVFDAGLPQQAHGVANFRSQMPKPRVVTDDGRVFFQTAAPLVAGDVNGRFDVYEFDQDSGQRKLLSGGTGSDDSYLLGIDAGARNVVFTTSNSLVAADRDEGDMDVYSARIGGGFAAPVPLAPPCEGDACRGPLSAPATLPDPATARFAGAGNESPARTVRIALDPISAAARRALAGGRSTALTVRTTAGGTVRLTLRARIGGLRSEVARVSRRAKGAARVRVPVRLAPAAARALRRGKRLTVQVEARLSSAPRAALRSVVLQQRGTAHGSTTTTTRKERGR